jgi:hypothetical protein
MQHFVVETKNCVPTQCRFCDIHRYAWTQAQITNAKPSNAPTNGRVTSVTAMITAAATPTITTHLNTAASLIFILSQFSRITSGRENQAGRWTQGAR